MAANKVGIELEVELRRFREAMGELPNITAKEARDMQRQLVREFRKAERAAAKTGRRMGGDLSKGLDKAKDTAERTASLMGGAFADVSDSVLDLGHKVFELSGTIGGVGGAAVMAVGGVGAFAAAVGFASGMVFEFVSSASEARDRLEEIAGAPPLPADVVARMDDYDQAMLGAEASALALKVEAASLVSVGLVPMVDTLTGLLIQIRALTPEIETMNTVQSALSANARWWASVASAGATEWALYALEVGNVEEAGRTARESMSEMAAEVEAVTASMEGQREMLVAMGMLVDDSAEATAKAEAAKRAAIKATEEAERERLAKWDRMMADTEAQDAERARNDAARTEARLELRRREVAATKEWAAAQQESWAVVEAQLDEALAKEQARLEKQQRGRQMLRDASIGFVADVAAMQQQHAEKSLQDERERAATLRDERKRHVDALKATEDEAQRAMLQMRIDRLNGELRASKEFREKQKRIAKRAFVVNKIAQLAQAAVNVPAAVLMAGAMAGPAGAVAMGITAAAQAAAIAAAPPPQFPHGGSHMEMQSAPRVGTDHRAVAIDPERERVISGQVVDQLGGPDAVDAMNQGRRRLGRPSGARGGGSGSVAAAARELAAEVGLLVGRMPGVVPVYGG